MKYYQHTIEGLRNSIPVEAYGYTVSMYSVALEGWRRGLTLKFINKNRSKAKTVYSLSDGRKEHVFTVTRGDIVPPEAITICVNKDMTKKQLMQNGVPVPAGIICDETFTDKQIIEAANEIAYPLVVKPVDGTGGKGVISNIRNEDELKSAINYVKHQLNYKTLLIEEYFEGKDYRLYVINDKVVAGLEKLPAHVIGDGVRTIKELLDKKNDERTKSPALRNRPIKIDSETHSLLRRLNYTVDSIPNDGEKVFLKTKNNISSGGDSIDVTDELSERIKEIAVNAANAIPGLAQCGIDMMVNKEEDKGVVLEINSRPHITAHLFPMSGHARDIPKEIIDFYFPNSEQNLDKPLYYFDFKSIFNTFSEGLCKEYVVPDVPKGSLVSKRFRVTGVHGSTGYLKRVQSEAIKLKLNGYVKHLKNGETSIVVSGKTKSVERFETIINQVNERYSVTKIVEKRWTKPVQIGFEIKKNSTKNRDNKMQKNRSKEKKSIDMDQSLLIERDYYREQYLNIINSKAWKITKPLKSIRKILSNK
ncbi:ATP-grasp domain-containing protein [Allobacillus sp. GCM10007491]|uniref:Acylphosphatase n=1 Tax=Allobacillus saliphilus TaxID=2912308 RepID=A0A941CZ60_9BACI|nr:ATP-grasp domain-containing protein [Allobacillus saliphilus]MBR7554760.1 ATP-grasp domain-containing protein [Allobacillus saliphilus]